MFEEEAERAVRAHEAALEQLWQLVRRVKRSRDLSEVEKHHLLSKLYSPLSTKDIKEHFVSDGYPHGIGVSFRSSMAHMMRIKSSLTQIGVRISPGGNPKLKDRAFAEQLGVPAPQTRQSHVPLSEVRIVPNSVIKPVHGAGARNVFYVDADQTFTSVKTGRRYVSFADVKLEVLQDSTRSQRDRWIVEEAILGPDGRPANDLKAYMFYGKVGLYLELKRNMGDGSSTFYRAYDEEGRPTELGPRPRYTEFEGSGVPADLLDKAMRLSLASPVPFLRFDFHAGTTGSILGEITPHPGATYAGDLRDELDKRMGHLFIEAEARLYKDLLDGKLFTEYFNIYS